MIAISKLCLFLSCLMLASSGLWEDWNNNLVVTSAPSAPLPSFWIRAKHTSIAAPMNERYNQYAYILNFGPVSGLCNITCGPRSFLGYTSDGFLICKRDQSTSYWGSPTLAPFADQCIPDVATQGVYSTSLLKGLANKGLCQPGKYSSGPYGGKSCCFSNQLSAIDLLKRNTGIYSPRALMDSEA